MEGAAERNENCNVCVCILFPWSNISRTWSGLLTEMRIAMSVCVYYSFDHLFSHHGGGCWEKWELQCLYVYIITLITYFPNIEWVAPWNENCIVCICILFPWSRISPNMEGGCSQKWELQCQYVYIIPLITYFHKHVGGCSHKRELQCICVCNSLGHVFPQTWRGCSQKWELQYICVYYSLDHLFPQHGGCCREKWELQCLCLHIIPLITYFHNMEGVAHINENCNACMCILFPWSPISPNMEAVAHINENCKVCMCLFFPWSTLSQTWRGCSQQWELQCIYIYIYIYYSLDYLFYRHGARCWEKWELQCLCVYIIPLITYFHKHGGVCSHKWELQCLYVYIIPLITYFPNMVGVAQRNENCNVCVCILFPWSPISPNMERVVHINENCNVYVYVIPLVTYFPKHGGVARINENCSVCMCIIFPWPHISQARRGGGGGYSRKWEFRCLYMYFIPLIIYFSIMDGDAERNEYCNVCMCILYPWSHISPTWRGLLREMRVAMSVCVYYSFDHLFPQHGGGCWEKWELQCLCVYIIPLITYFPNMVGVAHRNKSCNACVCILFPWSHISQTWRGLLTEMRIAMSVCVYYSFDHLFSHHGVGCREKWELRCLYLYIIPLITYFPNMEVVSHRNDNCNVCMCMLFPWSHISQTWRGLLT